MSRAPRAARYILDTLSSRGRVTAAAPAVRRPYGRMKRLGFLRRHLLDGP